MPKREKDAFDETTLENVQGMISKWISIPFAIMTVLIAGSVLRLIQYFYGVEALQWTPLQQELIRWGVIFGYYGGIVAGPLVDLLTNTVAFILAAIIALGGFIALGFYTDASQVNTANTMLIVGLLVLVSFAAAIATIAIGIISYRETCRKVTSQSFWLHCRQHFFSVMDVSDSQHTCM